MPVRYQQPQTAPLKVGAHPVAKHLAWLSGSNCMRFGNAGYLKDLVSGRTATLADGNNYLAKGLHPLGIVGARTIGSNDAGIRYVGPVGLLDGATEFTLFVSFIFRSAATSGQFTNFRIDYSHTLDIFSQTSNSLTFGCDWGGAWNGAGTVTLNGLNDGDVVNLLASVNQTEARLFANGKLVGTKSGGYFAIASASSAVDILSGIRSEYVQSFAMRKAIPDDAAKSLTANPWQIFDAPRRVLKSSAAGVHNLTGAASTQANTSGTGAVSQTHNLAGAASGQANVASAGAVSQGITLAGSACTQANTSSTGAIAQVHQLIAAASSQANASLTAAISQVHALVGATSTQTNLSSTGAETQAHTLAGSTCSQANTSSAGTVAQTHQLVGATSTQTNLSSSGTVATAGQLIGAPSTQANVSPGGTISQVHNILAAPTTQTSASSTGAVGQIHVLVGAGSVQTNESSSGALQGDPSAIYIPPEQIVTIQAEDRILVVNSEERILTISA